MSTTGKPLKENEERLVGVAVLFLSNPKVESESEELKKAFLKKKGLNESLINEAFHRYELKKNEQELKQAKLDSGSSQPVVDIEALIEKSKRTKFLSLRNAGITEINDEFLGKIQHVEQLILNGNKLTNISPNIKNLASLKTLHMAGCDLDNGLIPAEFYQLENLEVLNVSDNHLFGIDEFFKLKNLQRLDFSKNQITDFNIELMNEARMLKSVNLRQNNISSLPDGIRKSLIVVV